MANSYLDSGDPASKRKDTHNNCDYNKALTQLVLDFQDNPKKYFAEAELQYEFYCVLKTSRLINKSVRTNDGIIVTIVHPEYPSADRVQLKSKFHFQYEH